MADINAVVTALRNELVTQGIVRKPNIAGAHPPMHIEPVDGAPAPGGRKPPEDDATLVITLAFDSELPDSGFDGYRRRVIVNVRYRSKTTAGLQRAHATHAAIMAAVIDRADYGFGWVMDAAGTPLDILSSSVYGGLGRIGSSKEQGYDEVARLLFEVRT